MTDVTTEAFLEACSAFYDQELPDCATEVTCAISDRRRLPQLTRRLRSLQMNVNVPVDVTATFDGTCDTAGFEQLISELVESNPEDFVALLQSSTNVEVATYFQSVGIEGFDPTDIPPPTDPPSSINSPVAAPIISPVVGGMGMTTTSVKGTMGMMMMMMGKRMKGGMGMGMGMGKYVSVQGMGMSAGNTNSAGMGMSAGNTNSAGKGMNTGSANIFSGSGMNAGNTNNASTGMNSGKGNSSGMGMADSSSSRAWAAYTGQLNRTSTPPKDATPASRAWASFADRLNIFSSSARLQPDHNSTVPSPAPAAPPTFTSLSEWMKIVKKQMN